MSNKTLIAPEANLVPNADARLAKVERFIDAYSVPPQAQLIFVDNVELMELTGLSYRTLTRMRKRGVLKNVSSTRKCKYSLVQLISIAANDEFSKNHPMTLASILRNRLREKLAEQRWNEETE